MICYFVSADSVCFKNCQCIRFLGFTNIVHRFTDLEQKQHFQSFSFRATSKSCNRRVKYIVSNAGRASYAPAWNGSAIFVTGKPTPFDPDSWTRTEDTIYDEEKGELSWTHSHESHGDDNGASSAYFSYFPPYSYERHLRLVAKCAGKMYFFEISESIFRYF